jgi:hypothetical protein
MCGTSRKLRSFKIAFLSGSWEIWWIGALASAVLVGPSFECIASILSRATFRTSDPCRTGDRAGGFDLRPPHEASP